MAMPLKRTLLVGTGGAAICVARVYRVVISYDITLSKIHTKESAVLTRMALDRYGKTALFLGLSPFMIAGVVGVVIAGGYLYTKLKEDIPEIVFTGFVVVGVLMIVGLIVGTVCMRIGPTERFEDVAAAPITLESLGPRVEALEKEACDLITRTDQFIQNDIGKPGQDDPSLVTAAQQKARAGLPGPMTDCPATASPLQGLSAEILADLENRVTRLEATVLKFTLPEIQRTYDTATKCEGFAGGGDADPVAALADRITALEASVDLQKSKLLKAIDDKTAALQRGEVSDCDKKKAGKTAIATSNKMPAGTVTGV
jgi:hypothetical protein